MAKGLSRLVFRQPVIHRPAQMIGDLRDLAGRDQRANGNETAVPWGQVQSEPEVPKQHVGGVLDQARRNLAELLAHPRLPLLLRALVKRELRSRRRREL